METTFKIDKEEIASIGEELDETFLFQDNCNNSEAGSSVSSSVNSHSSECHHASKSKSLRGPKGFHKFWPITSRNKASDKDLMSQSVLVNNPNLHQSQPKFKCQISAPSTPINNTTVASSWTYGINIPLKHNSSFGSVDEEDEKTPSKLEVLESPKRSKSRLSLNLVGKEKSHSPRSPRKISKMIRSSFSRLLQLNGNENDNNQDTTSGTAPPTPSDMPRGPSMNSINSEHYLVNNNQELDNNSSVMTPSTLAYLEEAKQEGLPVIPFQYPTCVLIDKMKRKNPVMTTEEVKATNPKKAVKYDVQDWEEDLEEPKSPPGTLESIVDLAQKQLLKEDLDLEEEDFICGSIGSMSLCSNSNSRPRSRIVQANWEQAAEASLFMDEMDSKSWHDYLDMKNKRDSLNSRSNPIRIKEKQY